ncbi:MAG TPA: ATP-binding protein [Bacteroidia bacterium]|nr:ATP-binding protein [Bacteroidia bacterium]
MKIFKPGKFAFNTALVISSISGIIIALTLAAGAHPDYWWLSMVATLILFFSVYVVIMRALDRYFYGNLRIIYRNILLLKSPQSSVIEKKIPDHEVLPEINRMLIEWDQGKKEEIDHLKELEIYRKEFLGNVSHELKTPIFTIQGYIHTLLDGGIEDHEINLLYLQKAAKGIDRLISIVDDLESISKLEAGELILEHRTFDLTELVAEVFESIEMRAREMEIELALENPDERHYVYADKERVRQVFVNLLVNSIKYGKKGGTTRVIITDGADLVNVEVTDTGIGVEPQHVSRLFERFFRVDKSRSREQGGTGLGLAIVKHIIEAHGQRIAVESEFGSGTRFSFTLKKSK